MITKEMKLTYKLDNVSFAGNGNLIDSEVEIVKLIEDLKAVFGDKEFTLTAASRSKQMIDNAKDFVDEE